MMVEAQACGTPVIARAAGGALEAVVPGRTGLLTDAADPAALGRVLASFDDTAFAVADLRRHAERFGRDEFHRRIRELVDEAISTHSGRGRTRRSSSR